MTSDETASPLTSPGEQIPERIGPYRILRMLGRGGMGVVYLAHQEAPVQREVALKLIKRGMDTEQVLDRFTAERQTLAVMDHPSIARVYDAGVSEDGRPYFAMEAVAGQPVTEYCDRKRLAISKRLALFVRICEAVQHAHHKGVIHRDLKPSNVLVRQLDGRAVPKIIDFGVAKAIDEERPEASPARTQVGQLIGTPEYMSPEQAELGSVAVDARSDIYSLGVLLYELLVGSRPFQPDPEAASFERLRRRILEESPTRPSLRLQDGGEQALAMASCHQVSHETLAKRLRNDLDWIVMKALEKDPERRYSSASELAADIARHLRNEPVEAGPPSWSYRATKFVRRHRAPVFTGVALGLGLLVGFLVSTFLYLKTEEEKVDLSQRKVEVERSVIDLLRELGANDPAVAAFLQKLVKNASEDPRLQAELADAFLEIGSDPESQLEASAPQLIECLESSVFLRQQEIAREPKDVQARAKLALAHERLGDLFVDGGDSSRALDCYQVALDIRESLPEEIEALGLAPDSPPHFTEGEGNSSSGPVRIEQTRSALPRPQNRVARGLRREPLNEAVGRNHYKIGRIYAQDTRRQEALDHLQKAERSLETMGQGSRDLRFFIQANRTEQAEIQVEIGQVAQATSALADVGRWLLEPDAQSGPPRLGANEVPLVERWTQVVGALPDPTTLEESWAGLLRDFEQRVARSEHPVSADLSLALLLARCPSEKLRDPARAVALAEEAAAASRGRSRIAAWAIVAEVHSAIGDTESAAEARQLARELAGERGMAGGSLNELLEGVFRSRARSAGKIQKR